MKVIFSRHFKVLCIFMVSAFSLFSINAYAIPYGYGTYGTCSYGACGLTLTTSNNLSVNITPSTNGSCSINNDNVSVLTDDSTGYTVSVNASSSSNSLSNGSSNITSVSGSYDSPTTLGINQWGYRVDGVGGFGTGPTTQQSSINFPISSTFAGVPSNSSNPTTIITSNTSANPAATYKVWYGVCADTTLTSGTYSGTVVYTAVAN